MPQLTNLLSSWNIAIVLISIVVATLVIRRSVHQASIETGKTWESRAASLKEESSALKEEVDVEKRARKKFERRLIAVEADQQKSELRHQFDQGEKERYQEIMRMALKIILPMANGSKLAIEEKMRDLNAYQEAMRDKIWNLEETQRLFRTYQDDDADE